MAKASAIMAVERFLLVALLAALAKCKERVVLVLAVSDLRPRFAPRWVDSWERNLVLQLLLLLMILVMLLCKASDLRLSSRDWHQGPFPRVSRLDVLAQLQVVRQVNSSRRLSLTLSSFNAIVNKFGNR